MRNLIRSAVCLLLTAGTVSSAGAGPANDFDLLKQKLEGRWTFVEDGKKYDATFERVSHGAALLERNSGFMVVYYPDGHSLMMTLFTKDGYQVRLRAPGIDEKSSSADFVFQDTTNLAAGAAYMNGLKLILESKDHVVERWKMVDAHGAESSFDFELTRK
jgi:hypothetical protein